MGVAFCASRGHLQRPHMESGSLIIKIGGAAITDKSRYRCDLPDRLRAVAESLSKFCLFGRTVLVHGAGSFGHFEARDYKLNSVIPADWPAKTPLGIARCKASLLQLHCRVVEALVGVGVPAVSIPTFTGASITSDVGAVLKSGLVPVCHGDVLLSAENSVSSNPCRIVSGDEIVANFALTQQYFSRAVFITGVAGVFTEDPAYSTAARLIHHIRVSMAKPAADAGLTTETKDSFVWNAAGCLCNVLLWGNDVRESGPCISSPLMQSSLAEDLSEPALSSSHHVDVTGGIVGKLLTAVRLVNDLHLTYPENRFVISITSPEETDALGILCNPASPIETVLQCRATHIFWCQPSCQ